jgi:hypothetical protein
MIKSDRFIISAVLFVLVFAAGVPLGAQSIWLDYGQKKSLNLEILKPHFDDGEETFLTSSLYLTLKYAVTQNFAVVGELPFSHYGWDTEWSTGTESTLGNPYLGLEYRFPKSPFLIEIGARAPVAPDDDEDNGAAAMVGFLTDFVERTEAFDSDIVPISTYANVILESPSGFALRLRGGPCFWIKSGERGESETFLLYSAQAFYKFSKVRIGTGLSGRYYASSEGGDFAQNSWHQLGFSLDLVFGKVRPSVYFRIPLDEDFREIVDAVVGLSLGIQFD